MRISQKCAEGMVRHPAITLCKLDRTCWSWEFQKFPHVRADQYAISSAHSCIKLLHCGTSMALAITQCAIRSAHSRKKLLHCGTSRRRNCVIGRKMPHAKDITPQASLII